MEGRICQKIFRTILDTANIHPEKLVAITLSTHTACGYDSWPSASKYSDLAESDILGSASDTCLSEIIY